MMENGSVGSETDMESKNGRMVLSTMDNGEIIKLAAKESSLILMEISMMETG